MRIGNGYDVHRFASGRALVIGGVTIPYEFGLDGHSDADVLVHAICDALLGAAALGDIGMHFPDTDAEFKDADSLKLLSMVCQLLAENGWHVGNIDSIVVAQKPKLSPFIEQMRLNISTAVGVDISQVSVKATTEERLGFTGRLEGISAHSVCLIEHN